MPVGCSDGLLSDQATADLFKRTDLLTSADGRLILNADTYDSGFSMLKVMNRSCLGEACTPWKDSTKVGYGTARIRPELVTREGKAWFRLERSCQGSYGHGTTCSYEKGNVSCYPLPSSPQCAGWGVDYGAGVRLSGVVTENCVVLREESLEIATELVTRF